MCSTLSLIPLKSTTSIAIPLVPVAPGSPDSAQSRDALLRALVPTCFQENSTCPAKSRLSGGSREERYGEQDGSLSGSWVSIGACKQVEQNCEREGLQIRCLR